MAQKFTNFYMPFRHESLKFILDSAGREDERFSKQDGSSEYEENFIVESGFSDAWKENEAYIKLLEELGGKEMDIFSFIDTLGVREEE